MITLVYKQAPQTETPVPGTTPPSVTTPPPSTPPSTSEKDKPAEKEKDESEKEKAIPATPPTPNLAASGDVKMELEDKKDRYFLITSYSVVQIIYFYLSAMEDVKETAEAKVEPSTTSASTPPISEASNESTPTSEAATNDKEGQAKEEKGKEAEKEKEATKEKAEEKVKRIRKIFFGNNSFYVFFRLYQVFISFFSFLILFSYKLYRSCMIDLPKERSSQKFPGSLSGIHVLLVSLKPTGRSQKERKRRKKRKRRKIMRGIDTTLSTRSSTLSWLVPLT